MTHPADTAREHIMAGLEACQADSTLAPALEVLAQNLAQAQGKLFTASKQPEDSPQCIDLLQRSMDHLAQALKVLQEVQSDSEAVGTAAGSIAKALKLLHPYVMVNTVRVETEPDGPVNVNVNTMLSLDTDHQFYNGFSENIEEGGIFVATFSLREIGADVLVNFKLPGGRPVTAKGEVHWVREYNSTTPNIPPGMGVKFTALLPEDKQAIEEYIKTRSPMFYDA